MSKMTNTFYILLMFGRTDALLGPSIARDVAGKANKPSQHHTDWNFHYVNL